MDIHVIAGDLLDQDVDALISTANPQLNMSGGVNGAILARGGDGVQAELRAHLAASGRRWVDPGSVVVTGPGPLRVRHILHTVGIDGFYGSSVELVRTAIENALSAASQLGASTVAMPAIATGYGPLTMEEFGRALKAALARDFPSIRELRVVLRRPDDAATVRKCLFPV